MLPLEAKGGAMSDAVNKPPVDAATNCTEFRVEHLDLAMAGLKKRDLIRLLTLAGMAPAKTEDRRRELMALRLSRLVEKMTMTIEWGWGMPKR